MQQLHATKLHRVTAPLDVEVTVVATIARPFYCCSNYVTVVNAK